MPNPSLRNYFLMVLKKEGHYIPLRLLLHTDAMGIL